MTVALSFFWLVGMMNTMNWLDGADGLAGGVTFIAGATLFINSAFRVEPAQTSVSLLHLALMGAALGFVIYNFFPARIIMGGGATFLGYTLGALAIIGGAKMATILLVMGLPLLDSVWQVVNRRAAGTQPVRRRPGTSAFPADRSGHQPAPDRDRLLCVLRVLRGADADHGEPLFQVRRARRAWG